MMCYNPSYREKLDKILVERHSMSSEINLEDCKKVEKALIMAEKEWERTFNALPDLITILDSDHHVVRVNQAMANRIGVSPEACVGSCCFEVVHGTKCPIDNCPHAMLLLDGMEHTSEVQKDELGGYFLVTTTPLEDVNGKVVGSVHVARNITKRRKMENELRKTLEDKDMLMREIHHRVKNNLMVMSSLLNLQSRYIKDEVDREIFKDSQSRAQSMALIHEKLYRSGDLKRINMRDYIQSLSENLYRAYLSDNGRVKIHLDVDEIMLDVDTAIPLGLILNELLTNSMKYAFPENQKGEIKVDFKINNQGKFQLDVSDNGIGLPPKIGPENSDSLGMQLIYNLTQQIKGDLKVMNSEGARFRILFHEEDYQGEKND
jgi:PAS domain S-box-containing protein